MFGRPRLRYEVDTVLRYRCREGLTQRNLPLIRCQENGRWETPQISCVPRRPVSARRRRWGGTLANTDLGSNPSSVHPWLCDPGVITIPFWGKEEVG